MSTTSMTPGNRPRRGIAAALALVASGAAVAALVLVGAEAGDPPRAAGAVELATFASCDELAAWGRDALGDTEVALDEGGDVAMTSVASDVAATRAPSAASGEEGAAADAASEASEAATSGDGAVADGTNVAVEGVDEIDLVDRLGEDLVLVASAAHLAIVDLAAGEVRASVPVPWDTQVSYDAEAEVAWVVGHDDSGVGLVVERVAVGADALGSEGRWTTEGSLVDARRVGGELHVVARSGFGPVVGFGGGVAEVVPGASVASEAGIPFDGGPVPCDEVLHPVVDADPSATLLVTLPSTGPVEPVRAAEVVGSGELVHVTTEAAYLATPHWDEDGPRTGIHRFDLATLEATGSGTVEGSLLDEFSLSEHDGVLRVAVTDEGGVVPTFAPEVAEGAAVDVAVAPPVEPVEPLEPPGDVVEPPVVPSAPPVPEEGPALNRVVVLDTDGALDEVGRTEDFGHPGETLHGVRFAGDVGYAVTFLQTDPFYVLDLADPARPAVVGEVELPGFSSYLHPLGDGHVVGFGPGADGRAAAKLFDVSDPTAPVVVDDLVLGDESPVTWDHHAFVDLGEGRFAVPAVEWSSSPPSSAAVVVDARGGTLDEEGRVAADLGSAATRVLPTGSGWALLGEGEIVVVDAAGAEQARIALD